jgi:hypothetical protein
VAANGQPAHFDQVLSTVSPELMQRLAPALPASYPETLPGSKAWGRRPDGRRDRPPTDRLYWISLPKREGIPSWLWWDIPT